MTLLDISNQLISHFCGNSVFDQEKNLECIFIEKNFEKNKKELVISSLKDLEEKKMVKQISPTMWILATPLHFSGQNVPVSMYLANQIAITINSYLRSMGNMEQKVDALNIKEGNIADLVAIIEDLSTVLVSQEGSAKPNPAKINTTGFGQN